MLLSVASIAASILFTWFLSVVIEKRFHRSKHEFRKPHYFIALIALSFPSMWILNKMMNSQSPFIYAAYGLIAGLAALIAQYLFGKKLS